MKKKKQNNILITGGSGSLGQALVEKLIYSNYHYDKIIIYSRDEHKQEEMDKKFNNDRLRFLIGDIRDKRRLDMALRNNKVETIINAAALKVVPKGEYDPIEFVKTNVYGVQNIIECAIEHKVKKVLQVSTDKAVMPVNLYGATKLTAEKMIIAANNIQGLGGPIFGFVRYGNVTGSKGSVVPLFDKYIKLGKTLPITDKRMTRFWITLREASEFVLRASRYMTRDKNIFIPNMPAYNICDLAAAMSYPIPVKINYIGIRKGEKIDESIIAPSEYGQFPYISKTSLLARQLTVNELRQRLINEGLV